MIESMMSLGSIRKAADVVARQRPQPLAISIREILKSADVLPAELRTAQAWECGVHHPLCRAVAEAHHASLFHAFAGAELKRLIAADDDMHVGIAAVRNALGSVAE